MADTMTKAARSSLMSRIRGDKLGPETRFLMGVRKAMAEDEPAIRSRLLRNPRHLPGRPDVVFQDAKLAVFVHGCFWHCCKRHFRMPKAGRAGWAAKFEKNKLRDRRVRRQLNRLGYRTTVVWEHDLKDQPTADAVAELIWNWVLWMKL